MSRSQSLPSFLGSALIVLFSVCISSSTFAYKLTFFYDPATGNVSFDTAETRTGEIISYGLRVIPDETPVRFRPENHISLTGSALLWSEVDSVQEVSFASMRGFLTIGDVLPMGLSESTWLTLFTFPSGATGYSPGLGLPSDENIELVYGLPDREFDNRWDIVDPDTLDWATEARLIYREISGELLLDTRGVNSGHISGILLDAEAGNPFHDANFIPPWDSLFQTVNSERLSIFGNAIEPGLYNIGNVLAAGLTESAFQAHFSRAIFFGQAGFTGDLDLETEGQSFALVYVPIPEPASIILLTIAGMGLLNARRKSLRCRPLIL